MRKIAILSIFILSLFAVNMAFSAEQPEMKVYVADINASETAHVQIALPVDAQGKVNVSVNGQIFSANVVDGKATVNLTDLKAGDYVLNVTYGGGGNYSKISKDVNLKVNDKSNTTNHNATPASTQNATPAGNASGQPASTQNATPAGNASGGPVVTQNATKVTVTNQTNTSNTTNNTNVTPAKKVVNNTNKTVKKPVKQQPKKQQPKIVQALTNKNTGLPVLVLLLVAIGAVVAVAYRKR